MTVNRLDRRLALLRGKRAGCFDTDQYYLERASRGMVARKVRFALRRSRPVVLITPRWSNEHQFLDDIAMDLALGTPRVEARTLDLSALKGRPKHHSWTWIVEALTELCGLQNHLQGPAWQAVDARGFRHVVTDLLLRSKDGPNRCLMIFGLQYLNMEVRDSLIQVFETHLELSGADRRMNLLLATSVDASHFDLTRSLRLTLPDFSVVEAVEALVEYVGPADQKALKRAASLVGGVPALVHAVGRNGELIDTSDRVWKAIGTLADEIRQAMDIVRSDDKLSRRIEDIAEEGPMLHQPARDERLLAAGLVRLRPHTDPQQVEMRSPAVADLVLHG